MRPGIRVVLAAALAVIGMLAAAQGALATTYRVNKVGDPTPGACTQAHCTLREAVIAANSHPGADVIVLRRGKVHKLAIAGTGEDAAATGDLDITESVIVKRGKPVGNTPRKRRRRAAIEANRIDRVFETLGTLKVTFKGVIIREGDAPDGDGGVDIDKGTAKFIFSVIRNNTGFDDGGLGTDDAALTFLRSAVVGNVGENDVGGVDGNGSSLTFLRSTSSRNRGNGAGGLYVSDLGLITKSTISKNISDGADGGGLFNATATTTILTSTISANSAEDGGGIRTSGAGSLSVRNSTIASNAATDDGGGIQRTTTDVSLNNVTLARNLANSDNTGLDDGGGLHSSGPATFTVRNSLIALNEVGTGGGDPNCDGIFTSGGHNLRGTSDLDCAGFTGAGDFVNGTPKLGFLRDNGGSTFTVALLKGSPAINKGGTDAEPKDQRDVAKLGVRDIGAFEYRPSRK